MSIVVSICSARPNFVKLAAVHHALAKVEGIKHVIVHTGQHYDPLLSDVFFEQLDIPQPDFNLNIAGGTREEVIERTMVAFAELIPAIKPNMVLVYGDVNGAVGAARAAKAAEIPLGHVEAGLRSFDQTMPEEVNRIEIDTMSDVLFCSEQSGMDNLEKENVPGEKYLVGNTMIDTLVRMLPNIHRVELPFEPPERYAVATLHRPSNVDPDQYRRDVIGFLGTVNKTVRIVLPIHPRLRQKLEQPDPEHTIMPILRISYAVDPLGYLQFLKLMKSADFILTDSGGIQEEAVLLGKRCFTLRRNTERPSTIQSGSNVLIDPDDEADRKRVIAYAKNPEPPKISIPDMWDGGAGKRIVDILQKTLSP